MNARTTLCSSRWDVRISHPSSPEARFRAQRLYERDARQVERKIKRAPFSLAPRNIITLLCVDFVVLCAAFTTNRIRARDELSRLSLHRMRALRIAQRRIEQCVKFTLRLYSFPEKSVFLAEIC